MKTHSYWALFCGIACALPAVVAAQPRHAPVALIAPVQDKNFYVLSLMERTPAVTRALTQDPVLARMAAADQASLARCGAENGNSSHCAIDALFFSDEQIEQAGKRLEHLYETDDSVRQVVAGPMRRSGFFQLYAASSDKDLLIRAWVDAAHGIDRILNTYGRGNSPGVPEIDAPSFEMGSPAGRQLLRGFVEKASHPSEGLFFEPSLRLALLLLEVNHRDEAGRFEPLAAGENARTIRHLAAIDWAHYRYSVIVVPGRGPDEPGVSLAPGGRVRIELAAKEYREGMAPIILVSGGFVHPAQTPFCEAIEMKKALIADFGIPADVILIDPHARHTTTNLRNASRLIYRYGIPFDKPALITTDPEQSAYIESGAFRIRSKDELGYLPYRHLTRLSPVDLSFLPEIDSLQHDSRDPLDP
jgi:hypothetical protein